MELDNKWVLWEHPVDCNDWTIDGYNKLEPKMHDADTFWSITNNMSELGIEFTNFYLMQDGIEPTWEDRHNRNGGTCSFKVDIKDVPKFWELLTTHMVTNNVVDSDLEDSDDMITGLSVSPKIGGKFSWGIIKIWNSNGKNDISQTLNEDILDAFQDISIKYKETKPEH
jgi:hypothetical protein